MNLQNYAELYLKEGKNLTVLIENGKTPLKKHWNNLKLSNYELLNHPGNLGWVLTSTDLVIDVDPRNDGEKSYQQLKKDLNLNLNISLYTPNGGYHIYLKKPSNIIVHKNLKNYPGIDFLSEGRFVVIAGSKTPKGEYKLTNNEIVQQNSPINLLNLLEVKNQIINDLFGFQHSELTIKQQLSLIDPSCNYHEWINVGMALHSWDIKTGFELWENWSKLGSNYEVGETEKHWKSFSHKGSGITIATLFHMAKDAKLSEHQQIVENIIVEINNSNEKEIELNVIKNIKKQKFSDIDKERFAKTIQKRFKELYGYKTPIDAIRKMLKSKFDFEKEVPDWAKKYVYVNSHKGFMDTETETIYQGEAFNLENNKYITMDDEIENKVDAKKYVADNGFIPVVNSLTYLPECEDRITYCNNQLVYNIFDKNSLPKPAKFIKPEAQEFIDFFQKHIGYLIGEENKQTFIYWLAHQIQFPGKKIPWAPIIQSIYGLGKTFFTEVLQKCLGNKNVGVVFPKTVIDKYTEWATNAVVNILDEIRLAGQNRYEVLNCLKPLITNNTINIQEKFIKSYTTLNVTNYLCFTNFKDALPLDKHDRRWWVLFCSVSSVREWEELTGMPKIEYDKKMYDEGLYKYYRELHKWLLDVEISQEFLDIKTAPWTSAKEAMISTSNDSHEGLDEVQEQLTMGGVGYCDKVFSSSELIEAVTKNSDNFEVDFSFHTNKRNQIFKMLGFHKFSKPIKWNGKTHRIWVKNASLTIEQIKELLDKTLVNVKKDEII